MQSGTFIRHNSFPLFRSMAKTEQSSSEPAITISWKTTGSVSTVFDSNLTTHSDLPLSTLRAAIPLEPCTIRTLLETANRRDHMFLCSHFHLSSDHLIFVSAISPSGSLQATRP